MRAAPRVLVIDTAILIAAVVGRSADVIAFAGRRAALISTDRALEEAERRVALGLRRPPLLAALEKLAAQIDVVPVDSIRPLIGPAEEALRNAVPSRNGAISDAHILALAWEIDADIWSHDRDFAGTGVASWSTINLVRAMAETAG